MIKGGINLYIELQKHIKLSDSCKKHIKNFSGQAYSLYGFSKEKRTRAKYVACDKNLPTVGLLYLQTVLITDGPGATI